MIVGLVKVLLVSVSVPARVARVPIVGRVSVVTPLVENVILLEPHVKLPVFDIPEPPRAAAKVPVEILPAFSDVKEAPLPEKVLAEIVLEELMVPVTFNLYVPVEVVPMPTLPPPSTLNLSMPWVATAIMPLETLYIPESGSLVKAILGSAAEPTPSLAFEAEK